MRTVELQMNHNISILSKPPFPFTDPDNPKSRRSYYLDYLRKSILGNELSKSETGPDSVMVNLTSGLKLNNWNVKVNPSFFSVDRIVGVLSNVYALEWAIQAKRQKRIDKLIAGPNLVVLPLDDNAILCSEQIDIVITPSQWVSNVYCSIAPQLKHKIREWPVGVDTNRWSPNVGMKRSKWIIYDKSINGGKEIVDQVESELVHRGYEYQKINYGNYSPQEYKTTLSSAIAMVIVSASESQGLAQFEAWACDVPTLIWDRGFWVSRDNSIVWKGASSSPYFDESCGDKFIGKNDFSNNLDKFITHLNSFSPRNYILDNFTLEICAQKYITLFFDL